MRLVLVLCLLLSSFSAFSKEMGVLPLEENDSVIEIFSQDQETYLEVKVLRMAGGNIIEYNTCTNSEEVKNCNKSLPFMVYVPLEEYQVKVAKSLEARLSRDFDFTKMPVCEEEITPDDENRILVFYPGFDSYKVVKSLLVEDQKCIVKTTLKLDEIESLILKALE